MYYFKFPIPTNEDGSVVTYSPNYYGTMSESLKDVTVLLYNDVDGYGVARTKDSFVPKGVTVITEKEVNVLLSKSINQLTSDYTEKAIFFSGNIIPKDKEFLRNTIEHRWDSPLIVASTKEVLDGE